MKKLINLTDSIRLKGLLDEDVVNYKKASMFLATCKCDFKCARDGNFPISICQNSTLAQSPEITIEIEKLVNRYLNNPYTSAVVIAGMEPFLQFEEVYSFIKKLRESSNDDIVIYTGYYLLEVLDELKELTKFKNIIIKFGRYVPNRKSVYDELLGISLSSSNQFAIKVDNFIGGYNEV